MFFSFDPCFGFLTRYFPQQNNTIKWLIDFESKKEKWASRYTWSNRIFGMRSTQRSESFHSVIETIVSNKMKLTSLFKCLEDIKASQILKTHSCAEREIFMMGRGPDETLSEVVQELIKTLNTYAGHIVRTQAHQVGKYSVVLKDQGVPACCASYDTEYIVQYMTMNNKKGEKVGVDIIDIEMTKQLVDVGHPTLGTIEFLNEWSHITTCRSCSCQFLLTWGLPCRHMIRVWLEHPRLEVSSITGTSFIGISQFFPIISNPSRLMYGSLVIWMTCGNKEW